MRQRRRMLLLTLAVFGFSLIVAYQARSQTAPPSKPMKPFIARQQVMYFAPTLDRPIVHEEIFARRNDGSTVRRSEGTSPTRRDGMVGRYP